MKTPNIIRCFLIKGNTIELANTAERLSGMQNGAYLGFLWVNLSVPQIQLCGGVVELSKASEIQYTHTCTMAKPRNTFLEVGGMHPCWFGLAVAKE